MNQEVSYYLSRQLALGKDRLRRYVLRPSGEPYPKRPVYHKIYGYLHEFLGGAYDQRRWAIVPGLRGVGKTTLLAQLYFELQERDEALNILYISLDEFTDNLGSNLQELLMEYERILGESYEALTTPTILLLDEVQSDPQWASILKSLIDRTSNLFLLCSGSSAVHLRATADIAGRRALIEKMYPLSFAEYEWIQRGIEPDWHNQQALHQALFASQNAQEVFGQLQSLQPQVQRYLHQVDPAHWDYYLAVGGLPFALTERKAQHVYEAVLASVDKIITKDILQLGAFSTDTIPAIKRLLFILAESDVISNIKLAEVLGIHHLTVAAILEVLAEAEVLIRVPAYGSEIGRARKPSKYLFMSSVIRAAFFNLAGSAAIALSRQGRLLEDVAGLQFYREFEANGRGALTYDPVAGGADFVLRVGQEQIVIEIGHGKKTEKQVRDTMKRIPAKYGLVVSTSPLSLAVEGDIVMVPQEILLLSSSLLSQTH